MSEVNESQANENKSSAANNPGDANQSSASAEPKYTQADFNKLAANKAAEIEKKIRAEYADKTVLTKDDLDAKIKAAVEKGEERAKMSADQKAKAEFDDRQKSLAAERQAFQAEMDSFKADRALSATKESLIDNGLPKDFAGFLNDLDAGKRAENIQKFSVAFKSAVDSAVEAKVAGKHTPESTGGNQPNPTGMPKDKAEFYSLPPIKQQELYAQDADYVTNHFLK